MIYFVINCWWNQISDCCVKQLSMKNMNHMNFKAMCKNVQLWKKSLKFKESLPPIVLWLPLEWEYFWALAASKFDHSCNPNGIRIFEGQEMVIRTLAKVDCFEDIRISYLGPDQLCLSKKRRQEILETKQLFTCTCQRCEKGKWN